MSHAPVSIAPRSPGFVRPGAWTRFQRWLGGSISPYFLVAPFFVLFAAFGMFPLWYALQLSFTKWHGAGLPIGVGLDNYLFLLGNDSFWNAIWTALVLWLLIVPAQILISIAVAAQLSRRLRFNSLFRTVFLVPYLVPLVAIAQVWLILFDRDAGAVNAALTGLGLPAIGWFTDEFWAKPTMALLVLWKQFGFSILIFLAAIQQIPNDVYESAVLDGATGRAQFRFITVPLLRRTIVFFMIIATLGILQMFAEPYVLTGGGPYGTTITPGYALFQYTRNLDLGTGAAHSFLLMLIVAVLSLGMLRLLRTRGE
jgi:multiple sugar transport system permease protein/lactose/L-arabinose transport system permease protein/cellobiose transport system permease protein